MIVTPYCHILYTKIIKCCILHGDPFQYMHNWWGGGGGGGGSFKQNAKYEDMESSENIFNIETVLRYSDMFQGRDKV